MSSPEVEKFEATDYDYENEFNINRPRKRQTKSQAIYGSFGADSDEDDEWDGRAGFGRSGPKNYTGGINFISGGLKKSAEDEAAQASNKEQTDEQGGDVDPLLQTQFGRPKQTKPSKVRPGYRMADQPSSKSIGDWEKHTNKIGSTLMMKMGYKPGEGLGKDGRGISTPVEAKLRIGKGAIGFYGTERTERSLKDFPVKDEEADEEAKFKEEMSRWKRTESGKKKTTYVYKTADELIAKGPKRKVKDTNKSKHSQVKVIDMTGKEQRVLSGYHAISTKKQDSDEEEELAYTSEDKKAFEMPELLHNINMLIDLTEEEIITKDRQLRYERDMAVNMQHESERLETLCDEEQQQISRLTQLLDLIDVFDKRTKPNTHNPLSLEECADLFTQLQDTYYEEYKAYDLVTLAIAVVLPLVKRYFEGWQPLSQPRFGCEVMQKWKAILDIDRCLGDSTANNNVYSKLIWDVWMPIIRLCISQWNIRNPDALIELLEVWMPLLPPWMFQNILDQLINPRLQMEVDNWNPLTDTVPIHAWLHPWLPLMGSRLEPLWAPIRHRLASALSKWHPSDISAVLMLKPWVKVFSQGHMEAFLAKHIVPKLAVCLQEMTINPANQVMDSWKWVMSWQQMLPDQVLVNLLDRCFFPRWLHTLGKWLNTSPNYEEVGVWYKGWKTVLPERLIGHPTVKEWLAKALNVMNTAVSNPGAPVRVPTHVPPPPIPGQIPTMLSSMYSSNMPDYASMTAPPAPHLPGDSKKKLVNEPIALPLSGSGAVPHTFKDLVAMKAAEENLQFYPVVGKTHEARQVYQCGSVHISIDRGVIYLQEGGVWGPTSLNALLRRASN